MSARRFATATVLALVVVALGSGVATRGARADTRHNGVPTPAVGGGGAALATTTPAPLGTAAVGTGTTAARADHVHAMPTATDVGAVASTRQIIAGTGLTGGGTLAADRTLAVSYGTASGTALQGSQDALYCHLAGAETFTGVKTFGANIVMSSSTRVASDLAFSSGATRTISVDTGATLAIKTTKGTVAGTSGNNLTLTAAAGVNGNATTAGGAGGSLIVSAGDSGNNNGAGQGAPGSITMFAGSTSTVQGGSINLVAGSGATPGVVSLQGPVALASAATNNQINLNARFALSRVNVNDADYTAPNYVGFINYLNLTAAHTVTLPALTASSYSPFIVIKDESGNASGVNTITVATTGGGGTLDGVACPCVVVTSAYGVARLYTNGTNWFRW